MYRINQSSDYEYIKVNLDDIKKAYVICACFIKKYRYKSEKLLPIFERLEREIMERETKEKLLEKALMVAYDN